MRKRKIILLVFIATTAMLLAFSACQAEQAPLLPPTTAPTSTASVTPSKTITQTPTLTTTPTQTLNPRDFDTSSIKTITPAAPAQCPAIDTSIEIDVDRLISFNQQDGESKPDGFQMDVFIDYLNQGVPMDALISAIEQQDDYKKSLPLLQIVDVTGDNINELIYQDQASEKIVGCVNKEYKTIATIGSFDDWPTMEIVDANNDNLPDLSVLLSGCGWGNCTNFHLYTWNGTDFVRLNPNDCFVISMPFTVSQEDIDNNGTLEIILYFDAVRFPNNYPDLFPMRTEKATCMWNGSEYLMVDFEQGPPFYRFQALRDASMKRSFGYFDEALELYWQAINDHNLEWYTDERNEQEFYKYADAYFASSTINTEPNPTPFPVLTPNPDEYDNLAAYAYFRIIMIHLLQDDITTAKTVYEEMLSKYPVGCKQSLLTESAEIMLENYKESTDIHVSCTEVVKFVKPQYEELFKLYDYFYWAGISSPANLCPYWEGDYANY